MLKFFSRLERTRNLVLLLFGFLMVVSLGGWGVSSLVSRDAPKNLSRSDETVAKVGSETITVGEVASLKQGRMATLPAKMLLNSIIGQRIIRAEANRLGLRASDAEVADEIRTSPQFKKEDGTMVEQSRYEQFAVESAGSISAFEETIRDQVGQQKLFAFLTSGVTVSEEELLSDFDRKNTKFDLSYVSVSVADIAQTLKPTDEELKAYFEKNKASYYISQPQKKIRYVYLDSAKIGEKLTIPEADLKAAYDNIPQDKRSQGVEGQQIVLRVPKPEFEGKTLETANQIVEKARKDGGKITEDAFTALVKGYSEDAASKQRNGKLAGLIRENPANPTDPYQTLLKMQEGDVSEPIKNGGNYYILRRGKDVPKTFEDARKELDISLRNSRAFTAAAELAQKVAEDLKQTKDVQATAAKFAKDANMSVQDMVRETPFVKPGDDVPKVGNSPQFEEGIATLENPNDVGDKFQVTGGFAVPLLVEKREPRDAEFDEVKNQVAEVVKLEQARAKVEEIAKQIAAGTASAEALSAAAQSKGLKAQEQKSFILGSPLGTGPTASTSEALEDAIYALKNGEVTKTPLKVGDNWYVVAVTKREDANKDDFTKQRDQLLQSKLSEKRGKIYSDYVAAVRAQMEKNGQIVIYKEVLDRIDGPEKSPFETE